MRISDWSSDVCSSDLAYLANASVYTVVPGLRHPGLRHLRRDVAMAPGRESLTCAASECRGSCSPAPMAFKRYPARRNPSFGGPGDFVLGMDGGRSCRTVARDDGVDGRNRSEEHTSELQSLMRISDAVFCLKKKKQNTNTY